MITSISLTNFKCYGETTHFPLTKINLLTGINGKGKSSFLQSLLLFRQSVEHSPNTKILYLNGSCVNLGVFENVKNSFTSTKEDIKIVFRIESHQLLFAYTFTENETDTRSIDLKSFWIEANDDVIMGFRKEKKSTSKRKHWISKQDVLDQEVFYMLFPTRTTLKNYAPIYPNLSFKKIHYVSADRLGPQEFYPKNNLGDFIHVGKKGEYVVDVLSFYKEQQNTIPNTELARSKNHFLETQASEWMSYILDTENVNVLINENNENSYINTLTFKIGTKTYTPPNVGFGYSYILPIIVAGLVAKEGEILIIENPEAHLHPRAQSRLTNFLAKVASMGVQVFIESHSDHILNALRVAVKKEELASDDVQIFYFANDTESSQPKIFMPKIDKNGGLTEWPDGFFDEWENSLMELV